MKDTLHLASPGGRPKKDNTTLIDSYLPTDACGYVRQLDERDRGHRYYALGWFGFFDPQGDLLGSSENMETLNAQLAKTDFVVHYVH